MECHEEVCTSLLQEAWNIKSVQLSEFWGPRKVKLWCWIFVCWTNAFKMLMYPAACYSLMPLLMVSLIWASAIYFSAWWFQMLQQDKIILLCIWSSVLFDILEEADMRNGYKLDVYNAEAKLDVLLYICEEFYQHLCLWTF